MFEPFYEGARFLEKSRVFFGREFLTWLWFHIDTTNHKVHPDFTMFVDDKIKMTSAGGSSHNIAITGGTPGSSTEAIQALVAGKTVTEAAFGLVRQDREYWFVLKCESPLPQNVKLPETVKGIIDTDEDMLDIRMQEYETVNECVLALYNQFMRIRVNPREFSSLLAKMGDWIMSK